MQACNKAQEKKIASQQLELDQAKGDIVDLKKKLTKVEVALGVLKGRLDERNVSVTSSFRMDENFTTPRTQPAPQSRRHCGRALEEGTPEPKNSPCTAGDMQAILESALIKSQQQSMAMMAEMMGWRGGGAAATGSGGREFGTGSPGIQQRHTRFEGSYDFLQSSDHPDSASHHSAHDYRRTPQNLGSGPVPQLSAQRMAMESPSLHRSASLPLNSSRHGGGSGF